MGVVNKPKTQSFALRAKRFVGIFFEEFERDEIPHRAAAVSFFFILSIFPTLIFIFSLIPYLPIDELDIRIMMFLSEAMPHGIYHDTAGIIQDIVEKPRGGLLSLGFFLAFYSTTSGVVELINTFNRCIGQPDKRNIVVKRLRAFLLTILLSLAVMVTVVGLIAGQSILDFIDSRGWFPSELFEFAARLLPFVATLIIFYLCLTITYRFGPVKSMQKGIDYGALFATLGIIGFSHIFGYYLANFSTYNKVYGSIGTLIAFMLWFHLTTMIILIGFEINACLRHLLSEEANRNLL